MPAINSRGRGRRTISEINMVPFIDVMLVLLIIFMVTAPLITPSLPKVGKAPGQPPRPIQIEISKDEVIQIKSEGQSVPTRLGEVGAAVKRLQPTVPAGEQITPVVISADKSIKYETVVKVMDALNKAGVARVGLSVQTGN